LGENREQEEDDDVLAKGVAGIKKIQRVRANLGVTLVVEENGRKVNSRGEQDRRREELDSGEVPVWEGWRGGTGEVHRVTKKFAGEKVVVGGEWSEEYPLR
jgi:hypothetical protein